MEATMMFLDCPACQDAEDGRAPALRPCRDRLHPHRHRIRGTRHVPELGRTYADYRAHVPALIPGAQLSRKTRAGDMSNQATAPQRVGIFPFVHPHRYRLTAVAIAVGVAILLEVMTILICVALFRGPAPAPSGQPTRTSVVVPHPSPGPFGS